MSIFSRSKTPEKSPGKSPGKTPGSPGNTPSFPSIKDGLAGFDMGMGELEPRIQAIGGELLKESRSRKASLLSTRFWSDKLMDWAMQDEGFKVQLFRFVDAFPMLKTPQQVHEHLMDYLTQPGVTLPAGMGVGLKAGGLLKGAMTKTVTGQIEGMAKKFIAGTDAASAQPLLKKLWDQNIAFSVDLLGEACVSDAEADAYREKYLDLVNGLPGVVGAWPQRELLERDHLGAIPRTNVSIKITSLFARTDPIDQEGSIAGLLESIRPILEAARDKGVFINFDIEQFELKDLTLDLFMRCCEEVEFEAGLAMQAYLRSGDEDAQRVIQWAKKTGRQVTVRLVKGAYWDYETIHAEQEGWPVPVWSRKRDTDACFERMTQQFIENMPRSSGEGGVKLALGSHNLRSIATALALLEKHEVPESALELQMLHGMGEELKAAAVARGLRVREYIPVGEMIPGMAYLVRRLLENTSNESWLKSGFVDNAPPEVLLASPHGGLEDGEEDPGISRIEQGPERHELSPAVPGVGNERPFFTEPMRDFSLAAARADFSVAVGGAEVPEVNNDSTIENMEQAVERAVSAFPAWRDTDPRQRALVLTKAAEIMRSRRDELSAIIIRESGKTWREADGDVCEAIDFCEYYARLAVPLFEYQRLGNFIGELDQVIFQPRGVAAIISPWNFPLAICTGMTAAALVTGNTAIVKPAEQTPGIAKVMCEIFWKAGAPPEVLHFLPGIGETVGAALVRHPKVSLIAFTGSKAVGLDIIQAAGLRPEEQSFVKKVVCEMGGKNAIIIDASADLDEAVLGVRQSAFGFQGQKCSACSRAIVVDSAHDTFLRRLVASTKSLVIGDPRKPGTDIGPVIDAEAAEKISSYVEIGKEEGVMEVGAGDFEKARRHEGTKARGTESFGDLKMQVGMPFVAPHIFSGIRPEHRLAREEIFGPVLAVIRVADFAEALAVANATEYKLTGGVYSRKPSHLDQARKEFRVGNLYLNRTCTGALVGRQPFGGFGMSGVGSKAGGADYLLQFVEPRAVCENTMRRGFAPGL